MQLSGGISPGRIAKRIGEFLPLTLALRGNWKNPIYKITDDKETSFELAPLTRPNGGAWPERKRSFKMGEFLKGSETEQNEQNREPVGIGPVIAGWQDGVPVYYVDLLFADGSTKRLTWQKAKKGADRSAKLSAIRERINLAKRLRPAGFGALIHDADSFNVLVGVLSAITGGKKRSPGHP